MARIRSIHPEQWTDDQFATCGPLARLLALGIRNWTDDNGIFEWNPVKLKMRVLPADNCDVTELLNELESTNQVFRYKVQGKDYGIVRSFQRFQNPKSPKFIYPAPLVQLPDGYDLRAPNFGNQEASTPPISPKGGNEAGSGPRDSPESGNRGSDGEERREEKKVKDTVGQKPPDESSRVVRRLEARAILDFLNEKTGRAYQPVDANLDLIVARLKDGATVTQCRQVIAKKTREWSGDEKMAEYLRPATLFNRTKFAQYVGELVVQV